VLIGIDASRAVDPAPTGTETYSRELIRALLARDRENSYRLYTRRRVERSCFGTGSNIEIRAMTFPRAWTHARLSWEMLSRRPDILWVPAHVLPVIHPRRSIVTVHDLGQIYFPEAYPAMARWYHNASAKWNARAASHLLADSQATKNDLVKFSRVAPDKITVVYPAYDSHLYQPVQDQVMIQKTKDRYGVAGNYVLAIGTVHPRKNYARLIRAMARLEEVERSKDWRLVIVGKRGWLHHSILKEAESLNHPISFLDYVPAPDLAALLSGARLFVFPSLHEGFGLPILEAQACGTPVVCSKSSSLPEAAGNAAIFFDPLEVEGMTDAIRSGLRDERLRAEMVSRGFENVKRFSWESSGRQVHDIITKGNI
jgi:glycosyltransferase involved in cell wall biosynthesis